MVVSDGSSSGPEILSASVGKSDGCEAVGLELSIMNFAFRRSRGTLNVIDGLFKVRSMPFMRSDYYYALEWPIVLGTRAASWMVCFCGLEK